MSGMIRITAHGGPDVLDWTQAPLGAPGDEEVRVRHTAIGVNYIDIYHRTGLYPVPLPSGLGLEAAGIVEAVGKRVTWLRVGDRVAYASGPPGAYSERRNIAAAHLVRLPDDIDDRVAAAAMLQGMTVQFLVRRTYEVRSGDVVLWHAAAGGVGLLACQWLRSLGATVIGTVSSDEKAELARQAGCTHTIVYTRENVIERVRELTGGAGVPVVYDSIGKDTFEVSLAALRPRGLMVSFGNASGPVPPFNIAQLAAKGSLYITRPVLATHIATREDLETTAEELFAMIRKGAIKAQARQTFALKDAALAHRALESRATTGSSILLPEA